MNIKEYPWRVPHTNTKEDGAVETINSYLVFNSEEEAKAYFDSYKEEKIVRGVLPPEPNDFNFNQFFHTIPLDAF